MLVASYYTFKNGSFNNYTGDKKPYCRPAHGNEGEMCKVWCEDEEKCVKGNIKNNKCDIIFRMNFLSSILWIIGISLLCIGIVIKYYFISK